MVVEITIEKGTSLHDLASKLGWDVDKLIEANRGLASWLISLYTLPQKSSLYALKAVQVLSKLSWSQDLSMKTGSKHGPMQDTKL